MDRSGTRPIMSDKEEDGENTPSQQSTALFLSLLYPSSIPVLDALPAGIIPEWLYSQQRRRALSSGSLREL